MMSVAFKEGLKIPPPAMNEIILAANQDIRQVMPNKLSYISYVNLKSHIFWKTFAFCNFLFW